MMDKHQKFLKKFKKNDEKKHKRKLLLKIGLL